MTTARLVLYLPSGQKVIPLEGARFRIGRSPDNEIVLDDPSVSRHHAVLDLSGPQPVLRDETSTCGTWVSGERISRLTLQGNERIRFGDNLEAVYFGPEMEGDTSTGLQDFPEQPPLFFLEGLSEDCAGKTYTPKEDRLVIGRDPSCDIHLDILAVSRRHAEISREGGTVSFRDLDSTNGVFLNGKQVKSQPLRSGDEIRIDVFRFRFQVQTSEPGINAGFFSGQDQPVSPVDIKEIPVEGKGAHDFLEPDMKDREAEKPPEVPEPPPVPVVEDVRTPDAVFGEGPDEQEDEPSGPGGGWIPEGEPETPMEPRIKILMAFIGLNLILLIVFVVYYFFFRPEPLVEEQRPIFPSGEARILEKPMDLVPEDLKESGEWWAGGSCSPPGRFFALI